MKNTEKSIKGVGTAETAVIKENPSTFDLRISHRVLSILGEFYCSNE